MSITDDLREAIERRLKRETRYRIAKDSGVDFAILSRFLSGQRSPQLDTVDRLEFRDVHRAGVLARANNANSDGHLECGDLSPLSLSLGEALGRTPAFSSSASHSEIQSCDESQHSKYHASRSRTTLPCTSVKR